MNIVVRSLGVWRPDIVRRLCCNVMLRRSCNEESVTGREALVAWR
jgi:hypothetical protein